MPLSLYFTATKLQECLSMVVPVVIVVVIRHSVADWLRLRRTICGSKVQDLCRCPEIYFESILAKNSIGVSTAMELALKSFLFRVTI